MVAKKKNNKRENSFSKNVALLSINKAKMMKFYVRRQRPRICSEERGAVNGSKADIQRKKGNEVGNDI